MAVAEEVELSSIELTKLTLQGLEDDLSLEHFRLEACELGFPFVQLDDFGWRHRAGLAHVVAQLRSQRVRLRIVRIIVQDTGQVSTGCTSAPRLEHAPHSLQDREPLQDRRGL